MQTTRNLGPLDPVLPNKKFRGGVDVGNTPPSPLPSSIPYWVASGVMATMVDANPVLVPLPAGMATDDLMIMQVLNAVGSYPTTPSGWSILNYGSLFSRVHIEYYKFFQPGDTDVTLAMGGFSLGPCVIHGFRGVNTATPFETAIGGASGGTTSAPIDGGDITTVLDNCLVFQAYASTDDAQTAPWTFVTGAMTEYDNQYGVWGGVGLLTIEMPIAGAQTDGTGQTTPNLMTKVSETNSLRPI